jgi:dipeptidyl aminopeptidase/acylaminoacyl peptidase
MMRLNLSTHSLATAAVIAGGTVGLLAGPGPASATVPGTNGTIVTTKCMDGSSCKVTQIWTVDPATGSERPLIDDAGHWDDDPVVSPDGTRVAFQRCTDSTESSCTIGLVGIGGGTPVDFTSGSSDDYPAFSPDGTKMVFSRGEGGYDHLFLIDASGGTPQPLTSGNVQDREATWSPDGSSIAFSRGVSGPGFRIFKLAVGGGSPVPLTAGTNDYSPSFTPDGSQIAFQAGGKIEVMGSNGDNLHSLTPSDPGYRYGEPVFSPDGSQILFDAYSFAAPNPIPLMVMNADGSNPHTITSTAEVFYRPDCQSTHPVASPPPAQVAGPTLTLTAPKKESFRKGRVYLFATSSKAAASAASGKVSVPNLAKSYRLGKRTRMLAANTRTKITLNMPRKTVRAVRVAFAHHKRV